MSGKLKTTREVLEWARWSKWHQGRAMFFTKKEIAEDTDDALQFCGERRRNIKIIPLYEGDT